MALKNAATASKTISCESYIILLSHNTYVDFEMFDIFFFRKQKKVWYCIEVIDSYRFNQL